MKKSELKNLIREHIELLTEVKTPQEIYDEGKKLAVEIKSLIKKFKDLEQQYVDLIKKSTKDLLINVENAAKAAYNDVAKVSSRGGEIYITFIKNEDLPRELYLVKRKVENEFGEQGVVNVTGGSVNSYGEYKTVKLSLTKAYIKKIKDLPSWTISYTP
jgi:hypothetical protein